MINYMRKLKNNFPGTEIFGVYFEYFEATYRLTLRVDKKRTFTLIPEEQAENIRCQDDVFDMYLNELIQRIKEN